MRMIVLSTELWDAKRQARKELLYKALINRNEIESLLYVEPMVLWWRKNVTPIRERNFGEKVRVCRWHCPLPGESIPFVQQLNRTWQAKRIDARLSQREKAIGIFYHPVNWLVAQRVKQKTAWFYDWTEDWGQYQQSSQVACLQEKAVRETAGVLTVSETLYEKACEIRGGNHDVLLLPNATSLGLSQGQAAPEPNDLMGIPRPRIGLMGHIGPWMDSELIVKLAKAQVDWQWCILGDARGDIREQLNACKNVHLLGIHPYDQLPDFMEHMSVLVAPYNNKAQGDSSKLYDYLTSGKPIISSDLDTAHRLSAGVTIATSATDWLVKIETALSESNEELAQKRRLMAQEYSWQSRSELLLSWLSSRGLII